MRLKLLAEPLWIYRFPPDTSIPQVVFEQAFYTISKTQDELSIVVSSLLKPSDCVSNSEEGPWRGFKVMGPLDFALTGILAALANPLAEAGIPIFAISTYDTDYLLVEADQADRAKAVLQNAGNHIIETS